MALKKYKPTTPGRRFASVLSGHVEKKRPEKKLTEPLRRRAGRSGGKISVRHRGGGAKRLYRLVDFRQQRYGEEAEVLAVEYDPNRTANIALIAYKRDGKKSYILAPEDLKAHDTIVSSQEPVEIRTGNRTKLEHIPTGLYVMNVELSPGRGGVLVRSAGAQAQLMALEGPYAHLKLPSGEVRMVPRECLATIGQVSNVALSSVRLGKAGRTRHRRIRPTVRGKVMNPVDHPHGGGEGNQPIGLKYPKTPWGKHALGVKTRRRNKKSNARIVSRRKKRK
jgi:large subunit ribosomal protein L2